MKKLERWQFILLIILYPIGIIYFCVWLYRRNKKAGKIVSITLGALIGGTMIFSGIGAALGKNEPPSVMVDETTPAIIETTANTTTEETTTKTEKTTTTAAETTLATTTTATETEATTPAPETLAATEAITAATETAAQSTTVQTVAPTSTTERENHFTDHNNPEQQNTIEYVLNTSTMRIHYPTCNDVKKIKPENYGTTTDFQGAIKQGYKACGHCHPF